MNRTQLRTRIAQEEFCKNEIDRMLKNSQTKAIMPVITIGLLDEHIRSGKQLFNDSEIEAAYRLATKKLTHFLRHDIYIGAKYYDAYGSRMSRYGVLKPLGHLKYKLLPPYTETAEALVDWIPTRIKHGLGLCPHFRIQPRAQSFLAALSIFSIWSTTKSTRRQQTLKFLASQS